MTIQEVFLSEVAKEGRLNKNGLIYIYKWYNLYNAYCLKKLMGLKWVDKKQKKAPENFLELFYIITRVLTINICKYLI